MTTSILLLGESGSGKTHYGAQLLGRLLERKGELRMNGAPESLAAFEAALQRLNAGLAADHTAQATFTDSHWSVANNLGRHAELYWPDYGGEQVKDILEQRNMPAPWQARARGSDAWIVLVRVGMSDGDEDIFSRPLADLRGRLDASEPFRLSDQARAIELLQMLLYARAAGVKRPLAAPQLTLLLSCWDELKLPKGTRPRAVLEQRLPMLADFVAANWRPDAQRVLGLSALERALSMTVADQDYITRGPETFGFIVGADGRREADLTQPVAKLIA